MKTYDNNFQSLEKWLRIGFNTGFPKSKPKQSFRYQPKIFLRKNGLDTLNKNLRFLSE
jgi:hypothetical protein